jgi:hypothetical protein
MKVCIDMSIAQPPASVPYAEFAKVQLERDQWRTRYQQEQQAHTQTKRLLEQERQRDMQRRQLWKTKLKPAEKATLEAFQRQLDNPKAHRDDQGFTRIVFKTAAINIGMSDKAPKNNFDKVLAQCPDLPKLAGAEIQTREEYDQELKRNIPRLYMKTERSLIEAAIKSEISQRKVQGGNQYECQRCHSKDVTIYRRLHCNACHHEVDLDPTYPNGKLKGAKDAAPSKTNLSLPPQTGYSAENDSESADDSNPENFLTTTGQLVGMVIEPVTPPNLDSITAEQEAAAVDIEAAAELLLKIAGQDEKHIIMPRTHESKYLDVKRPLQLADLVDHLRGGEARGALCAYQDGSTYALIFDTDDPEEWETWRPAAFRLVQARYIVILDESPAGRGGHLVIIFDTRVLAAAARAAVLEIAPELESCREYWPGGTANRVRLPGAFYARYGKHVEEPVKAWCRMFNVATGETSNDGRSAARLLLSSLTDASIVPALPPISAESEQPAPETRTQDEQEAPARQVVEQEPAAERAAPLPNKESDDQAAEIVSAGAGELPYKMPKVDAKWESRYGKLEETTYWFAIIPEVAAAWYNERHSLEDIRPCERNKKALSPNGNERTGSTGYHDTAQGERWTDFSQHGQRADGSHESGDALELAARVEGKSKGAYLSGVILDMIKQSKAELESAAAAGQPLPASLEEPCIITPAGRRKFAELSAAAAAAQEKREAQGNQQETVTPASVTKDAEASVTKLEDQAQARQDAQPEPPAVAARKFYDAHCSMPGYSLRIRPDGLVGIGVPEDLSDIEFEQIAEQVSMHGEALRQIIQERDPQHSDQADQREQKPALVKDQRVTTPAGMATVSVVTYCDILKRWRCSVLTQEAQPDSSHFAVFDATEVQPIEQRPLL